MQPENEVVPGRRLALRSTSVFEFNTQHSTFNIERRRWRQAGRLGYGFESKNTSPSLRSPRLCVEAGTGFSTADYADCTDLPGDRRDAFPTNRRDDGKMLAFAFAANRGINPIRHAVFLRAEKMHRPKAAAAPRRITEAADGSGTGAAVHCPEKSS